MLKIKTLTSSLTAVALVGGIGFAYAQATATDPATTPSTTQAPTGGTTDTAPSTTPSSTPSQPMASDPAPQADRN